MGQNDALIKMKYDMEVHSHAPNSALISDKS